MSDGRISPARNVSHQYGEAGCTVRYVSSKKEIALVQHGLLIIIIIRLINIFANSVKSWHKYSGSDFFLVLLQKPDLEKSLRILEIVIIVIPSPIPESLIVLIVLICNEPVTYNRVILKVLKKAQVIIMLTSVY